MRQVKGYQVALERSAVAVVDFQRDIVLDVDGEPQPWAVPALAGAQTLVTWARAAQIPVIWVTAARRPDYADAPTAATDRNGAGAKPAPRRLLAGTEGVHLAPPLVAREEDYAMVKPRVSAFYCTPLEVYLRRLDTRTLFVCGVYTHMGVEATVRAAYDRDFDTFAVADACGAPSAALHEHAVTKVLPAMSMVVTTADLPSE